MKISSSSLRAILIAAIWLPLATTASSSGFLLDGDFDNLETGFAPDPGVPAGAWAFGVIPPHPESTEDDPQQIMVVPTSGIDSNASGNSLRINFPSSLTNTVLENFFTEPIQERSDQIVRAGFDFFVPDSGTSKQGGFSVVIGGGRKDSALAPQTDRGPQFSVDSLGRFLVSECSVERQNPCTSGFDIEYVAAETPLDTWQRVQFDIDLVKDSFDIYWSSGDDPLELIAADNSFRSGTQDFLDRFEVILFQDFPSRPVGEAFIDNISIEVIEVEQRPGDANYDGRVDSADLNAIGVNWQTMGGASWSQGDFTGDGMVNAADLNVLALNWQTVPAAAAAPAAVPEPSSITLLLLGLCAAVRRRMG